MLNESGLESKQHLSDITEVTVVHKDDLGTGHETRDSNNNLMVGPFDDKRRALVSYDDSSEDADEAAAPMPPPRKKAKSF